MKNNDNNLPWLISFNPEKKKSFDHFLLSLKDNLLTKEEIQRNIANFSQYEFPLNLSNKLKKNLTKLSDELLPNFTNLKLNIFSDDITNYVSDYLFTAGLKHNLWIDSKTFSLENSYSKINRPNHLLKEIFISDFSLLWPSSAKLFHYPSANKNYSEQIDYQIRIIENFSIYLSSIGSMPILSTIGPFYNFFFNSSDILDDFSEDNYINKYNRSIIDLGKKNNWPIWNLNKLINQIGIENFWDPVKYNYAKLGVSLNFTQRVSENIASHIASLTGKNRRAIILDLDNTLWGGIVGDDGIENIKVGFGDAESEAFLRFQNTILDLKNRGFILAVCSKNSEEFVKNVFKKHPDMLISLDDISVFVANWENKAKNIVDIAQSLNIGLSSIVFIDDNPVERDSVRNLLPEVAVVEIGNDPSFYSYYLLNSGYFTHSTLSNEDISRTQTIQSNKDRELLLNNSKNFKEYLASLKMEVIFEIFDEAGKGRVHSLINKTNQFNLTNIRFNSKQIKNIAESNDFFGIQIRFKDKFSNYGIISVVILEKISTDLLINNWYMSCRVFERGIEDATMNEIVKIAKKEKIKRIIGGYLKTDRNAPVSDLYQRFGFLNLKSSFNSNKIKSQNNIKYFYINTSQIKEQYHSLRVKSAF